MIAVQQLEGTDLDIAVAEVVLEWQWVSFHRWSEGGEQYLVSSLVPRHEMERLLETGTYMEGKLSDDEEFDGVASLPQYSKQIAAAWRAAEKVRLFERGYDLGVRWNHHEKRHYYCVIQRANGDQSEQIMAAGELPAAAISRACVRLAQEHGFA